jgi:hypothetical protein
MQEADRKELALKQQAESTYADGIAALNKDLFAYQETQRQNKTTAYNTLLGYAMDSELGLTEETIRAMGKNAGLSEEEIQQVVDIWNGTKKSTEFVVGDVIKDIQNGAYVKEDGSPYTWDEIHEMLLQERNAGEKVTDVDIAKAKMAYDRWIAYKEGKVSTDEYYNAANGDENAQGIVDNAVDPTKFETEAKSKAESYGVRKEYVGKVIDTNRDTYTASEFGDFNDIDDPDSKQGKYVQAIINDAKAGKIKEGQIVHINYGNMWSDGGYYMYVGDGVFVRISDEGLVEMTRDSIYLPDGYHWNIIDQVKKD